MVPTDEKAIVIAPAREPRLTAVLVPPEVGRGPLDQYQYRHLVKARVQGMINRMEPEEALAAIHHRCPSLKRWVDSQKLLDEAGEWVVDSEEVLSGRLRTLLYEVAWPVEVIPAAKAVDRQVRLTGLQMWLALATPPPEER
jgi:hypothetical protein